MAFCLIFKKLKKPAFFFYFHKNILPSFLVLSGLLAYVNFYIFPKWLHQSPVQNQGMIRFEAHFFVKAQK